MQGLDTNTDTLRMQGLDEYSRVSVRVCYEIESGGRSEWAFKVLRLLAYWYKSTNTDASYVLTHPMAFKDVRTKMSRHTCRVAASLYIVKFLTRYSVDLLC